MLSKIYIRNFALIDELEVDLHSGMQVITGETGAGKSILLGALRLIMGERADSNIVGNPDEKSIVEATFKINKEQHFSFFQENDLDFTTETIVRRELSSAGKSRAFINDTPVTLNVLKRFTENLIDIHSQFENSNLFEESYQFNILDGIGESTKEFSKYQSEYQRFINAKNKLKELENQLSKSTQERDYHRFLLNELEVAELETVDLEEIKSQLATQENAETIIQELSSGLGLLQNEEIGVLQALLEVRNKLNGVSKFQPKYGDLLQRIESARLELQDISNSIERELDEVEIDPEELQNLNYKLNLINNLLLKHQAQDVEELMEIQENLSKNETQQINLSEEIEKTKQFIENQTSIIAELSKELTKNRKKSAHIFSEKCEKVFQRLGLNKAKLVFQFTPSQDFNKYGKDKIELLFQANEGYALLPIQNAISGGERARVMFAIKKITAEIYELPTLILDEIDAGISGKIAEEMGKLMRELSAHLQLVIITHLPQIAAKGNNNYKVFKREVKGKTQTTIMPLSQEERIKEIAQLLSGNKVTTAAIEQAQELMKE